jgi:hypothetical protein
MEQRADDGNGMVLDDKVEEVGCLGFDGWIGLFSEHALVEVANQTGKSGLPHAAEEFRRLAPRASRSCLSRPMAAVASATVGSTPPATPLGSTSSPSS